MSFDHTAVYMEADSICFNRLFSPHSKEFQCFCFCEQCFKRNFVTVLEDRISVRRQCPSGKYIVFPDRLLIDQITLSIFKPLHCTLGISGHIIADDDRVIRIGTEKDLVSYVIPDRRQNDGIPRHNFKCFSRRNNIIAVYHAKISFRSIFLNSLPAAESLSGL